MKNFREIEKGSLRGRIPLELEERIREEAYKARTSYSLVLSAYVARGMGYDPQDFGIGTFSIPIEITTPS